ncbi:Uncharacterized conserved protein YdaU, DUF1376 family [Pseudomonas sp. NFACC02]|uniref:YdaU family protein n=1 Tax=Pseudomonas sp. NFACC02 TaxID=1566250 RepID=UPI0008C8FB1B|nr:YdaU family protein [Pseudomonas sp. NFACC02]SEP58114.1 Uncharacterized conserved protein YdaU, DUF1376 family [Pseudomonas sp. NFACC02]
MNFFPFHPGDYMLRTAHLDPIEDLAYRRLIDLYYVNEAPLTGTPEELARVIRLRSNAAEVSAVLREFFIEEDGTWNHGHCDDVIEQYRAKAKQAAENGKNGGRPKKTKQEPKANPEETQPVISDNPEETGSKANQEPITNNQIDQDQEICAATAAPAPAENLQKIIVPDQPKSSRGTRLPADWTLPQEWRDWAAANRSDISVDLEADKFRDHWHAATGTKATKADWLATWRNWVRNANTSRNVHAFPAKSRYTNLPQVNADEIRAKTEENKRLGVRRANF